MEKEVKVDSCILEEGRTFLPVVTFNTSEAGNQFMELQTDNLNLILSKCSDRPVVIVSILGPTSKGKSTYLKSAFKYLSYKMRYYHNCSRFFKVDLKLPSTSGIQIWNEPILTKSEDGKEVAVLLMDTQGLLLSSNLESMWTFGFTTLISSVTIFNQEFDMLGRLNVDYFLAWMNFLEHFPPTFGKVAKLLFLLRDSPYTDGKEDLADFLQGQGSSSQRHLPSAIKIFEKTFDTKTLWRIPCPFKYTPSKKEELQTTFDAIPVAGKCENAIRASIHYTFNSKELIIKKIFGLELTTKHLPQVFQECVTFLNELERNTSPPLSFAGIEDKLRLIGTKIFMEEKGQWLRDTMESFLDNSPYGFLDQKTLMERQDLLKAEILKEFQQLHPINSPETKTVEDWFLATWPIIDDKNVKVEQLFKKYGFWRHLDFATGEYQRLIEDALNTHEFETINFQEIGETCLENFKKQFPTGTDKEVAGLVQMFQKRLKEKFSKLRDILDKTRKMEKSKKAKPPLTRSQVGPKTKKPRKK